MVISLPGCKFIRQTLEIFTFHCDSPRSLQSKNGVYVPLNISVVYTACSEIPNCLRFTIKF